MFPWLYLLCSSVCWGLLTILMWLFAFLSLSFKSSLYILDMYLILPDHLTIFSPSLTYLFIFLIFFIEQKFLNDKNQFVRNFLLVFRSLIVLHFTLKFMIHFNFLFQKFLNFLFSSINLSVYLLAIQMLLDLQWGYIQINTS